MDLHNGTVCGSSSSAERYSEDELEDEQSRTNDTMIVNATMHIQATFRQFVAYTMVVSNELRKFASKPQTTLCIQYLYPDLYNVVVCY